MLLAPHPVQISFDSKKAEATLGGHTYADAPQPITVDGSLYLPLRYTLEALGSEVDWDPQVGSATFPLATRRCIALPGTGYLTVDGAQMGITSPVRMIGGRSYVAAQVLTQVTGLPVSARAGTVTIGK